MRNMQATRCGNFAKKKKKNKSHNQNHVGDLPLCETCLFIFVKLISCCHSFIVVSLQHIAQVEGNRKPQRKN